MSNVVECWPCGGCGVDEAGEYAVLCMACKGSGSLTWTEVCWLGMAHRYPAKVQLEQGTLHVREAITAIGGKA